MKRYHKQMNKVAYPKSLVLDIHEFLRKMYALHYLHLYQKLLLIQNLQSKLLFIIVTLKNKQVTQ